MRAVGIKVLKNKLSEYVRLASGGEVVLVTDHDRVVAELVPPNPARSLDPTDAHLAELARQGVLRPRICPYVPLAERVGATEPLQQVLEGLDADRNERAP